MSDRDDDRIVIDCDALTDEAYADYEDFMLNYEESGCRCFISPPCGFCTHPGNPICLVEDPTAWKAPTTSSDVMDITKRFLG